MSLLVVVVVGLVVIAALLARFEQISREEMHYESVVDELRQAREALGVADRAARRAMDDAAGQSWRTRFDPAEPG